jgi:Asp-tRNA(Asn)/Glu-tRNA(Gln) amidotransferase A subunit family amidase
MISVTDRLARVSGPALRALALAIRRTPAKLGVSALLRRQLGIHRVRSLDDGYRGDVPLDYRPVIARPERPARAGELDPPAARDWPRSARALAAAYRAGQVTPEEVTERALSHARALAARRPSRGPLHVYDDERALAAAREAGARIREGRALGPLDGVPIVIKEEVDVAGLPTRLGTGWMPATPAARDAAVVTRLRAAGAVVLGLSPMTEYGMSPLGVNIHRDMPRNAHHAGRLPGGSSSGSAVAVATGVVPVALGADGGGSIRIPAALNGVFGLKPTYGRVPSTGKGLPGGSSVVHIGPLGASAEDLALFLAATAGADPSDPSSAGQPPLDGATLAAALGAGVRGLRIGVDEREWDAAPREVAGPAREALAALERDGAELVPIHLSHAPHAAAIGYLTIGLECLTSLAAVRRERITELGADLQLLLSVLSTFEPDDYLDAQRLRAAMRQDAAAALREVDVIALPTTATAAPPVTDAEAEGGFLDPAALDAVSRYAYLGNLTGLPAGTAPVGLSGDGLPLGLQIIGDAWDEPTVLAVLAHLERAGVATPPRPDTGTDLLAP